MTTQTPFTIQELLRTGRVAVEGRAVTVVVELLAAAWDAVGPGLGTLVRIREVVCFNILLPAKLSDTTLRHSTCLR